MKSKAFLLICLCWMACESNSSSEEAAQSNSIQSPSIDVEMAVWNQADAPLSKARIESAVLLATTPQASHHYNLVEQDTLVLQQHHRIHIQELEDGSWMNREIYNVYQGEDAVELYASEMLFDGADTVHRQAYIDYQVVVRADTAFISTLDGGLFKLEKQIQLAAEGKQYPIFVMLGLGHIHDIPEDEILDGKTIARSDYPSKEVPIYRRYWNPKLGTLLVDYGQETIFSLQEKEGEDEEVVKALVDQISKLNQSNARRNSK